LKPGYRCILGPNWAKKWFGSAANPKGNGSICGVLAFSPDGQRRMLGTQGDRCFKLDRVMQFAISERMRWRKSQRVQNTTIGGLILGVSGDFAVQEIESIG
jgi:hypothetical protein